MTPKKFAFFTDAHLGQRLVMGDDRDSDRMRYADETNKHKDSLCRVLSDIAEKGISDIVFGGDIGASRYVSDFFEILGSYDFRARVILGNHDRYDAVSTFLPTDEHEVQGKACFSQGDLSMKWVFLDSSANRISKDQLAWLEQQMAGVRKLMLFLHHPILTIDTPIERAGAALQESELLISLLTSSQCDISVFCGHYHMADDRQGANIRQYCTPAVSYQIVKKAKRIEVDTTSCAYRIVEMDGDEIKTQVVCLR